MSKQTILLGTPPTGVGGDTPRSAFTKAQSNFDELYTALGAAGSPAALPAALPISKGGTGNTTGTASKLAPSAIVGTVSQSGGVPTGAIIQTGSNAIGTFVRLADGTQICFGETAAQTCAASSPQGGFYNSTPCSVGYAATFSSAPLVLATAVRPDTAGAYRTTGSEVVAGSTTSSPGYRGATGASGETIAFRVIAIGRWF